MPLLPLIFKAAPYALAWGAKFFKQESTAKKIEANPRATNGGTATVVASSLVALGCVYAESKGVKVPLEIQAALIAFLVAVGGIYTAWRARR